jgi:intracellular sulfur oxidation DsrE/DsrF family protein
MYGRGNLSPRDLRGGQPSLDSSTTVKEVEMEDEILGKRRDFLGLAAVAAVAGLGSALPATQATAATGPSTDFTRWLDSIPGTHRQVYDMPELNNGMGLAWSHVFLLTGAQGYGVPESDLGVVVILRYHALPLAFKDSVWAKYKLGEVFKIDDPETKAPAVRNPFWLKPGALPIPDAGLQKLIDRGVRVAACNMSITFYSGMVAQKAGLKHEDVMKEWLDGVQPGITVVPSGVLAINGAVSRGCVYVFAG